MKSSLSATRAKTSEFSMKALLVTVFALLALFDQSSVVEADNTAALQVALNTCYRKTKCDKEILADVLLNGKDEEIPSSCDAKCYPICIMKLVRLGDEKNGIDQPKTIAFLEKTLKDDPKLRDDITHFLNLCFDPAKETANELIQKCKASGADAKADCDDKWGCYHAWGVMWCAIENDGVMIMSEHADKAPQF